MYIIYIIEIKLKYCYIFHVINNNYKRDFVIILYSNEQLNNTLII